MISGLFSLPISAPNDAGAPVRNFPGDAADAFFAGPENALVRSLHKAAGSDFVPYNPIVLYGPAGAGKTTIAHAIPEIRRDRFGLQNVIDTTGVDLARALAHALDTASVADLRARYHRCDLLLIDDLHRLKGKPAAQQFLLSAFDALVHRGSPVIVTLRQAPLATPGLAAQLVSRLTSGLVARIALPGPLARREVVEQTAARFLLPLAPEQIVQIAGCGEVADNRYLTAARLRLAVLKLAAAREFEAQADKSDSADQKTVCRQIAIAVAKQFGLTLGELKGKSRRQAIADARGLTMFLVRRLTNASYAEIGRYFGGRDHTTVLHACRKAAGTMNQDDHTRQLVDDLAAQISAESVP